MFWKDFLLKIQKIYNKINPKTMEDEVILVKEILIGLTDAELDLFVNQVSEMINEEILSNDSEMYEYMRMLMVLLSCEWCKRRQIIQDYEILLQKENQKGSEVLKVIINPILFKEEQNAKEQFYH